jgi:hypothetical protein
VNFGYIAAHIRGINTETPPSKKFTETKDEAFTVESAPQFIWNAQAGELVRKETEWLATIDSAGAQTHLFSFAIDDSAAIDATISTRHASQVTTLDYSLTEDSAKRVVNQVRGATDTSLTTDVARFVYVIRPLESQLSFVGTIPPKH